MTQAIKEHKIKVLQLHPSYNVRAHDFADLAEQILHGLPASHFETVSGYLSGEPEPNGPVSVASRSVYFRLSDRDLKGLRLRAMWRLYRFCKAEQFDVVICNRFKPLHMMMIINRWLRIPLCIGIAHSIGEYTRRYRRWQVKRNITHRWRMVGVSEAVRQYLIDCGCGFTEDNTVTITNAIDLQQAESLQYEQDQARQLLGLPPAPAVLIGTIGRLVPVKGHRFLIEAFAQIAHRFPDSHLVIIGGGREEGRLRAQIDETGLTERIHLTGTISDAMRYVRAFDIWTIPSLSEGLTLALLEGISGHLPVIGSDIPALRPVLTGADAARVPPGNTDLLAQALADYLSRSNEERRQKGEQAYHYLVKHHDIGTYRAAYHRLITDALQENTHHDSIK